MMRVALAGNPNSGKSTLFNQLTGARQKIGNYPGVTVEKKEGKCRFAPALTFIDLPGTYSLSAVQKSEDEKIARDLLLEPTTDQVVVVVDATNLERQLFLATQVMDLERPTAVVVTMMDVLRKHASEIRVEALEAALGIPVYAVVGTSTEEARVLVSRLSAEGDAFKVPEKRQWQYREATEQALQKLQEATGAPERTLIRYLSGQKDSLSTEQALLVEQKVQREFRDVLCDFRQQDILARYQWVNQAVAGAVVHRGKPGEVDRATKILDRLFLSKIWAPVIFVFMMVFLFQAVFTWSAPLMDGIEAGIAWLSDGVRFYVTDLELQSLLVDGVITGVGNVIIFLPQICILFFLLAILDETGYLARTAFIVDLLFSKVGLSGRAFIPLLSAYACAVPSIMATRTIRDSKERLATILVAPLMTCSARLPVYTVLVGAFIPALPLFWGVTMQGLTFFILYAGAGVLAYAFAFLFRKTLLKGKSTEIYIELPRYRLPHWRNVWMTTFTRGWAFVRKAGSVILVLSVLMWALATYPRHPSTEATPSERLEYSVLGKVGHQLEPFFGVFGFDWKMGVSLGASFVAREVAVSTLATLYSLEESDEETQKTVLTEKLKQDPAWSLGTALSYIVFFVFAMQCLSTLAVTKKETNSWRWPLFMFAYLTGTAFLVSYVIHRMWA